MPTAFFYIVATVYIMVAGKPVDPEGNKQYFQHQFETMEQCKSYLNGTDFPDKRNMLALMFKIPDGAKLTIVADCGEHKAGDPLPGNEAHPMGSPQSADPAGRDGKI